MVFIFFIVFVIWIVKIVDYESNMCFCIKLIVFWLVRILCCGKYFKFCCCCKCSVSILVVKGEEL